MGHDVFISYSSHDKKVADAACALLEQRGHRCWVAPRDILSGMEWGKAIVDGIRGARVFVLIFSANANRSPQVNREVERAVSTGTPIIPFRIEDVAPSDSLEYFISNQHWLDALTPPLQRHLGHLADVVARLLGAEPQAGPAASPAVRRNPSPRWWAGGIAAAIGLAAIMLLWRLSGASEPAAPLPSSSLTPNAAHSPSATAPDRAWLYGRWCVDGNRGNVQTISGDGNRIVTVFSGQRQVETVRESAAGSISTNVATYAHNGDTVIVSEPNYSYRLERCR
jgi:hypothetical protein